MTCVNYLFGTVGCRNEMLGLIMWDTNMAYGHEMMISWRTECDIE